MKAQQLRNAVLQLAIQGKLVLQDQLDESASVLLQKIKVEKEQLIKDKKIKREKTLPEITGEEIPFDIPDSWEWVRLRSLCYLGDGKKVSEIRLPYLEARYLRRKKEAKIVTSGKFVSKNSYVILVDGENSGEVFYIDENGILGSTFKVLNITEIIISDYLMYLLKFYQSLFRNSKRGVAIPHLDKTLFRELTIALPPLAEQQRIVAKIEEIMPLIDQYEKLEIELTKLEDNFPKNLKKSILQYAVIGKLVEQSNDDDSANVLLEKIKAEKEQLINDKKIKREKTLPEITEEEKPFIIPGSWEWVRLAEIFKVGTGMTPLKSENKYYSKSTIPWITSSLTSSAYINNSNTYITEYALNHTTLKLYGKGTLILAMYGQGKTRGQISQLNIDATINQACSALESIYNNEILICYVKMFFKYNYDNSRKGAEGSAQPNLNLTKVKTTIIPLPPLKEQQRIVAKVDELMILCNLLGDENALSRHKLATKESKIIELNPLIKQQVAEVAVKFDMVARAESISPETQAKMAERIKILRSKK